MWLAMEQTMAAQRVCTLTNRVKLTTADRSKKSHPFHTEAAPQYLDSETLCKWQTDTT